jgi:hypothetical protein
MASVYWRYFLSSSWSVDAEGMAVRVWTTRYIAWDSVERVRIENQTIRGSEYRAQLWIEAPSNAITFYLHGIRSPEVALPVLDAIVRHVEAGRIELDVLVVSLLLARAASVEAVSEGAVAVGSRAAAELRLARALRRLGPSAQDAGDHCDVMTLLSEVQYLLKRWEESLESSDSVLRVAPADFECLVIRGLSLVRLGRAAEGIEDLRAAAVAEDDRASIVASVASKLTSEG